LDKFKFNYNNLYLIFTRRGINIEKFPAIKEYLEKFKPDLKPKNKNTDQAGRKPGVYKWFEIQDVTAYYEKFKEPKLIYPETTGGRGEFFVDESGMFLDKTCFMITGEHLYYFNAILSSILMEWYLEGEARLLGKQGIQYSKRFMELIPIPEINEKQELQITTIVKEIYQAVSNQKSIEKLETKLNSIVYKLYNLSEDEIAIIER